MALQIDRLHDQAPWRIANALPALGRVRVKPDDDDLGRLFGLTYVAPDGRAVVYINQMVAGTPLEGVMHALAAARILEARYGNRSCTHSDNEWTIAARLAVPTPMVTAYRDGLLTACQIAQMVGVPRALVTLRIAITPNVTMHWGTDAYMEARTAALDVWHDWLDGTAETARRLAYTHVISA
jgi:hypothetical protein